MAKEKCASIYFEMGDYDVFWESKTKEVFMIRTNNPEGMEIKRDEKVRQANDPIGKADGILDAIRVALDNLESLPFQ